MVLLAPTARAIRSMLTICDRFSRKFDVTFNENKSKCIRFNARNHCYAHNISALSPQFEIGDHVIENVLTWPHLGHIFSANLLDNDDFWPVAIVLLARLTLSCAIFPRSTYLLEICCCSSHYGAELWDLTKRYSPR